MTHVVAVLYIVNMEEHRVARKVRSDTDVAANRSCITQSQTSCCTSGRDGRDGLPGRDGRDGNEGPIGVAGPPGSPGSPGPKGGMGPSSGVAYVRWGLSSCPSGSTIVYSGRAAGKKYNQKGGTTDFLCLPDDPLYRSSDTSHSHYTGLYSVEYEIFGSSEAALRNLVQSDVSCALCYSNSKSVQFMLPARHTCQPGWNTEYSGYMMSEWIRSDRQPTTTICIDEMAQPLPGSAISIDPAVVYVMKATCNGLLCPPYDAGRPLTCAVCTK